ncbi:hypothetical protein [Halalkalibacter sp. APA_J-10(15)]|nr:hypothetical protein [Halalkalibacter sp. APA_J-10(15)]MCK0471103.1 hypothetical protein [Halalkalibacter sp. APA_J-10(15)]
MTSCLLERDHIYLLTVIRFPKTGAYRVGLAAILQKGGSKYDRKTTI